VERTLAILKPDCVRRSLMGKVLDRIESAGFHIIGMKMVRLSRKQAGEFYAVHRERKFYNDLVDFMTSDRVVALALEKESAVKDFRTLIGNTDPAEAEPGTIRREFAESKQENLVHGSDSAENGRLEVGFFFSGHELLEVRAGD
jgi:nucleoside-diphosphate kinase